MPITPFHFGPGVLVKSVAPAGFSFTMFALANIAIDLEPITGFVLIGDPLHRYLHNYLAATLIALVCAFWGRAWCERALVFWNSRLSPTQTEWLAVDPSISLRSSVISALLGTWSHVFLDSFMHYDVRPFWPLSEGNGLVVTESLGLLHISLVAMGVWGVLRLLTSRWDRIVATRKSRIFWPAKFARLLVGFMRSAVAVLCVLLVIFVPLEISAEIDRGSASFDSAIWREAITSEHRSTRYLMLKSLHTRLESKRPTRAETLEMLGRPLPGDDTGGLAYDVGSPRLSFNFYRLFIYFDDSGKYADTHLHTLF